MVDGLSVIKLRYVKTGDCSNHLKDDVSKNAQRYFLDIKDKLSFILQVPLIVSFNATA